MGGDVCADAGRRLLDDVLTDRLGFRAPTTVGHLEDIAVITREITPAVHFEHDSPKWAGPPARLLHLSDVEPAIRPSTLGCPKSRSPCMDLATACTSPDRPEGQAGHVLQHALEAGQGVPGALRPRENPTRPAPHHRFTQHPEVTKIDCRDVNKLFLKLFPRR